MPLSGVVSETSQLASNEWNGRAAIAAERESEQLDAGIHQQPAPAVGAYLAQAGDPRYRLRSNGL